MYLPYGVRYAVSVLISKVPWGGSVALQSCSADEVFILGTGYLCLGVLTVRGEVCSKPTHQ